MDALGKLHTIQLHGHTVRYQKRGNGPVLVLLHGITSNSQSWNDVIPLLAKQYTVIAPDLIGHGQSAKPQGDYSLGSHASGVRDLMIALGIDRATIIGHSLGGGIALQLAYQFPERVERLVLVSSGGLGKQVHLMLRAATLPGAHLFLQAVCRQPLFSIIDRTTTLLSKVGIEPSPDVQGMAEGFASLHDQAAQRAFLHTARSTINMSGQLINASDRLYLAASVPTLIIWGDHDPIIPLEHGLNAHELIPHSQLEVFAGAGHFPFRDDPIRFAAVVNEFIGSTKAASVSETKIRALMRHHTAA